MVSYQRTQPYPDSEKEALARRNLLIQTENDQLKIDLIAKEKRFEAFRQRVVDVALREAKEQGWCSEVNEALKELGLEKLIPSTEKTVTITYELTVDGEPDWDDDDYFESAQGNIDWTTNVTDWTVRTD